MNQFKNILYAIYKTLCKKDFDSFITGDMHNCLETRASSFFD